MPVVLSVPFEDYLRYRKPWLRWRNLGVTDHHGIWHPPISYYEALYLPGRMLDVFMELDNWLDKLISQRLKPKGK